MHGVSLTAELLVKMSEWITLRRGKWCVMNDNWRTTIHCCCEKLKDA